MKKQVGAVRMLVFDGKRTKTFKAGVDSDGGVRNMQCVKIQTHFLLRATL